MRQSVLWVVTVLVLSGNPQDRRMAKAQERQSSLAGASISVPTGAAWTDAEREDFRRRLTQSADAPQESYDLLKRSLLEGHFEEVRAALDQRDPNGSYPYAGYRFAGLRALCARAIFLRYARYASPLDWPSEEQGAELRRLARSATTAYEEAFRLAPSDFERACVYARWHELHTMSRFEADSLLLRGGSPLERANAPISDALAQQVWRLRFAVTPVLDALTPNGQAMGQEAKNRFLDVFAAEYQKLGRMGVPEDVFIELLDDIPTFLQGAIHPQILVDPQKHRPMLQYHIWYALTGPRPDSLGNEFIDRYVQTVDQYVHEKFASGLPQYEEAASQAFLELVELERSNRFIPRLKQSLWPYEWWQARNEYDKSIQDRIRESIDKAVRPSAGLSALRSFPAEARQRAMQEHAAGSVRSLLCGLMPALSGSHPLVAPPGMCLGGAGGTTHPDSNIWVYTMDKTQPVPPYPWKKSITPMDSSMASTRKLALRVLAALGKQDVATLDGLTVESKGFSKQDGHRLGDRLAEGGYGVASASLEDTNDILIERPWSWSVVRLRTPGKEEPNAPILVFQWKDGDYWLAWAGMGGKESPRPLARVLEELKPALEAPAPPEPVKAVPPAAVALLDDPARIESLEKLDAGHGWRVQLALAEADYLSPLKLLYCRAQWTDANRPAKAVPFGRYAARHLGPVLWAVRPDGFREKALDRRSDPTPPMSLRGDGCLYAAVVPLGGSKDAYVQVYCAFDGRELARQRITVPETSTWPWGYFMALKQADLFGVSPDFCAAAPGLPAFKPVPLASGAPAPGKDVSLALSLKDGFFSLKTDQRILPNRGSRLLARWWINDQPVLPQTTEAVALAENVGTEGLACLFRLPAGLPRASLTAKPGDKIGLQVMLCPDRLESPSMNDAGMQNAVGPDWDEMPTVPVLSTRIDFQVSDRMLAPLSPKSPTAATIRDFTDAIKQQDVRAVRRLVAEYPQLVEDGAQTIAGSPGVRGGVITVSGPRRTGQSALDLVCRHRPQPRYIWRWRIGGHTPPEYWKDMAEIAGILIDYGADVNARSQMSQTPLLALLSPLSRFGRPQEEDAPPVELLALLLERGADVNAREPGPRGTALRQVIEAIRSQRSTELLPIVEILLRHGANVFAAEEPWQEQSVFEQMDSLKKEGCAELAALIAQYGQDKRAAPEHAVRLGVEELLADLRNADVKALSALNEELPWAPGLDWLRLGRMLQEEFGPALDGLGKIDQLCIRGAWAEALLPTGRQGDRANLYVLLARYPGGAYHAVQAGYTEARAVGMRLRNAHLTYRGLMSAVYAALGPGESLERGGEGRTEYPRHFGLLSLTTEGGRLVLRRQGPGSWSYLRAELTSDEVRLRYTGWTLSLLRSMTFATGDRKLILADGAVTIQHGDRTMVFRRHEDQVQLEQDGQERLAPAFVLDLETLEVK